MPNLSDLFPASENVKAATLAYTTAAAVNSQDWLSNNAQNKINFNYENDPHNIVTVSGGDFTLVPGRYQVVASMCGFYAPSWGGSFAMYTGLSVGGTMYNFEKAQQPNNTTVPGRRLGEPVYFTITNNTTCFMEFRHGRTNAGPFVLSYVSNSVDSNTYGVNEWFKLNIVKYY